MKTTTLYDSDLHFEHQQWRLEISFWDTELKTFKNRLVELIKNTTDSKALIDLKAFQGQFTIHGSTIDELNHFINVHEKNMARHDKLGQKVINQNLINEHFVHRSKMQIQRNSYGQLKADFFQFLSIFLSV